MEQVLIIAAILLVVIFIIILTFIMAINLSYYILGYLPNIKAQPLNQEQQEDLLTYGIAHCTKEKNCRLILQDKIIRSSNRRKSYSNHFHKCTYFYAVKYLDSAGINFNTGSMKKYKIVITDLSDDQIKNIKIRKFDKSIIYCGDFCIEQYNGLKCEIIEKTKEKSIKIYYITYLIKVLLICIPVSMPVIYINLKILLFILNKLIALPLF